MYKIHPVVGFYTWHCWSLRTKFVFLRCGLNCLVHAGQLLLKHSADVGPSAFQGGREKAVGHAERLWMQIKIFHLQ